MSESPATPPGCYWRHTWPEGGPDFVLETTHPTGLVETIGRVHRSGPTINPNRWQWVLSCSLPFREIAKPPFAKSGNVATKREAVAALLTGWSKEEAWRASIRAAPPEGPTELRNNVLRIATDKGWSDLHRKALEGTEAAWSAVEG